MNLDRASPTVHYRICRCADNKDILEAVIGLIEEEYTNTPLDLIQSIATTIFEDFRRELQAHESAMKDSDSTRLQDLDRKIIDPLVKLTKQQIDKREETQKIIENLQKRINILSGYTEKLTSTEEKNDDSDNDSLHLEE